MAMKVASGRSTVVPAHWLIRGLESGDRLVDRMNQHAGSSDAVRHRLAARISLLLQGWERHGRDPNRREAFHVMEALRCLRTGQYDEGEAAVARAELARPIPDDVTGPGPHDRAVTADLRAALQTLLE